ncbi:AMMECR1 domain-containing protein [Geopyxis carbonaria]|nr:AMMECR1 domain-containing protein [Geopyxis carbonaria]
MATLSQCHYCFDVLTSYLENRTPLPLTKLEELCKKQAQLLHNQTNGFPNGSSNGTLRATSTLLKTPLFVTWKIHSKPGRSELRGCIGTFEPKTLTSGLREYAITAGIHDTRFDPISVKELSRLECSVTLLTDFEPIIDSMDWSLGTHGLQINFVYHDRQMGATYLPDVPGEQGWTKEETLISLMRKAGWTGKRDQWKKVHLNITRYQGSKQTVSWQDYQDLLALDDGNAGVEV